MKEKLGQIPRLQFTAKQFTASYSGQVFKEIFVMLLALAAVLVALDILRNGLVSYYFNLLWLFLAIFISFLLALKFYQKEPERQKFGLAQIFGALILFLILLFKTLPLSWFSLIITITFIILFIALWRAFNKN